MQCFLVSDSKQQYVVFPKQDHITEVASAELLPRQINKCQLYFTQETDFNLCKVHWNLSITISSTPETYKPLPLGTALGITLYRGQIIISLFSAAELILGSTSLYSIRIHVITARINCVRLWRGYAIFLMPLNEFSCFKIIGTMLQPPSYQN